LWRIYRILDAPLTADFFIPNTENYPETFLLTPERQRSVSTLKKAAVDDDIANVIKNMQKLLSKDLVDKLQSVLSSLLLVSNEERKIVMDLKNGNGSIAEHADDKADVK
ncbi:hypothetical protein COOONC_13953, partial [Cooperia oncophora]